MAEATTKMDAKSAIERIIADLTDRRGLRQAWEGIDDDTQEEIKATWERIVDGPTPGGEKLVLVRDPDPVEEHAILAHLESEGHDPGVEVAMNFDLEDDGAIVVTLRIKRSI